MGNYCYSGESKHDEDNTSEKSDTPTILKKAVENSKTENHDQSNTQANTFNTKEAIYLEETLSTENVLKTDLSLLANNPLSKSPTVDFLPSLPPSLHLLYGNPNMISKKQKEPKIVFYILSPFSDKTIEKDIFLKCYEFIHRKYQCSDFEIYLCDLHEDSNSTSLWKVENSCLVGSNGHDQTANCLSAISKYINSCYLVPILMLSDSVGDILLPLSFEIQDFLNILKKVQEAYPNDHSLIEKWYKLDETSKPQCYRLQVKKNTLVKEELDKVLQIFVEVLSAELLDLYFTTVVEQEINHTILFNQDVAKRCLWIQNTSETQKNATNCTLEKEILRRILNLRQELSMHLSDNQVFGSNFLTSVQHDQLELALQTSMCNIVEHIIDDYNCKNRVSNCTNGVDIRLLYELDNNDRSVKHLIQNRANFDILDDIKSFIKLGSKNLMIIEGQSGAGKTTLIAKIAENINIWRPNTFVITRFCRTSNYKCTPLMLLRSIVEQLSVLITNKPYQKYENDMASVISALNELLSSSTTYICFLLDDFHISFKKEDITWLSSISSPNIKCIITLPLPEGSTTELTSQDFQSMDLQKIEILKLKCSEVQWKDIINHGVGDINTTGLNDDLLATWSTKDDERLLVKAKILCWLAWLGITDLPKMSLTKLSHKVLEVLEKMFGAELASFIISIIYASRSGLNESEIIELMKRKYNEESNLLNIRFLWGKFSWIIESLLSNEKNVYFIDSIMRKTIKEKYEKEIALAHVTLLEYYTSQPDKYEFDSFKRWNLRKFQELPYQSSIIDKDNFDKSKFLTDLSWISSKLDCLGICSYLEDTLLCKNSNSPHIVLLCQIINENFTSLTYDAHQIYSHINQIMENHQRIETIDLDIKNKWMSYLKLETTWLKPKNIICDAEIESFSYDITLSLNCPGNYVVLLSKEGEQLCVWDIERCKKVRVLKNVPQPQSICLVGEYCVAVLCNREIKLLDLDNGTHIINLKGVMNQKMPYFAVHDPDHIVCLSRNRMYVNLMNLKSGDCITTFKAGEDRFLNSLLVSGDGRILVCGDETSKPFPLLVWNLTQRKLLYDLRIPHHDFVTALSAITHEGSYVAVVAKEIVEPSPNFIVVYDLQSGTLFKKWKPSCNTVALSISQKNMCVIAGLEDAKILMWDLVTGNCRGTLVGHTAPVTLLKIDPHGKILLSGDLECRDQSIRIWELNSGAHLASYTPKRNVLSCEITSDGKYIVLTFQGCSFIQTLELCGVESPNLSTSSTFGNKDFDGKVFDLTF